MCAHLTNDQLDQYHSQGYAFPIDVMTESECTQHARSLESIETIHGPMHYVVKPYLILISAFEIATHPCVLDAVESVLGTDILLWDSAYIIKEPNSPGFVSWHQDLTYWGLESDSEDDILTAWVALTPAMLENGCMRFVRDTRGGRYEHQDTYAEDNLLHRGQTISDDFREDQITHIELRPGQMSLHHGWAVHSSTANESDVRRVALSIQYIKPSVKQVVGQGETATLVRGKDNYNHFGPEPRCTQDLAPENLAFQRKIEDLKHAVYDSA